MKTGFRTKAVLVMPIISEASDELVGALQVMNKDDGGSIKPTHDFCKNANAGASKQAGKRGAGH